MALPYNLSHIRTHMSMWLPVQPSFNTVVAFLQGIDVATNGGLLLGFREWLIPRVSGHAEMSWNVLVLCSAFPNSPDPRTELGGIADQQEFISHLFDLLEAFNDEKQNSLTGLRGIYLRYEKWLKGQSWYNPSSPAWIDTSGGN